jgi:hypothetical protein
LLSRVYLKPPLHRGFTDYTEQLSSAMSSDLTDAEKRLISSCKK